MKASLLIMAGLTVLIAIGLRWREDRMGPSGRTIPAPRGGWVAARKRQFNRWLTAAVLAVLATLLVLGGLHWARVLNS